MLKFRVLSALVGIPLIIYTIWLGGPVLTAVIGLLAVVGILEYHRMVKKMTFNAWLPGMVLGVLLFIGAAWLPSYVQLAPVLLITVWLFLFRTITNYDGFTISDSAVSAFGVFYVGWLMSHVILLRELKNGFFLVLLVLVATWMTDTMAYFTGRALGRHKLAAKISPKKTVEGALGGLVGSTGGSLVLAYYTGLPLVHAAIAGGLVGVVGQLGDLIESAMKRKAGIKDSGNLIPGHGGVLDRFDSLLFTAPLVYYYVQVFIIN